MNDTDDGSDFSSDDDVCFGPYTMEEAKRDMRKCTGMKIERRHSSICSFTQYYGSNHSKLTSPKTCISSYNFREYRTTIDQSNVEGQDTKELLEKTIILSIIDDSFYQIVSAESIMDKYIDEPLSIMQEVYTIH